MSNSATHFCGYCNISRAHISEKGENRTTQIIFEKYNEWKNETNSDNKLAMNYDNCVHPPLIPIEENTPILKYIPPPELHILIGIVTHLFLQLQKEAPEVAENWINICKLKMFHGKTQFNGNTARELLSKANILAKLSPGKSYECNVSLKLINI